ncbi:MAG: class I SAM-dependent methyltransferase [Desulfobacteraceae bacterium]|nr:MAG: class I SAM-dependent methyltransferase [Desulfobacteraceae bacterium]
MDSLIDHYNELWQDDFIPPYITSLFPLLESLKPSPETRVFDVACGNGVIGKYLIENYQCRLWGTDISDVALEQCRKIGYTTELINLDQDSLPFEDQQFDLVILSAMLEHVLEPEKIIEMAYEKLTPGGHVIILTPNVVWMVNRLLFLMGKWDHRLMGGTKGHISYKNKRQLEKMITDAGFSDLNWDYSILCVAGNSDFCTKGVSGIIIQALNNLRVKFWHSLLAFNYIVVAGKS